jgi:hypothetical protein
MTDRKIIISSSSPILFWPKSLEIFENKSKAADYPTGNSTPDQSLNQSENTTLQSLVHLHDHQSASSFSTTKEFEQYTEILWYHIKQRKL